MTNESALDALLIELAGSVPGEEAVRCRLAAAGAFDPASLHQLAMLTKRAIEDGRIEEVGGRGLLDVLQVLAASEPTLHRPERVGAASRPERTLRRDDVPEASAENRAARVLTRALPERRVQRLADAAPTRFEPGALVNSRFILKERIGAGGMGIVFSAVDKRKTEARDPHPLVAIKIMNAEVARQPGAFMALQREARKAQTLAHPNIATVHDFDRDGETPYLCMELLQGRTLDAELQDTGAEGLERERALGILRDIVAGLDNAHRNGIVHSDLKPGNIFLTQGGKAKILDFGIARAIPVTEAPGAAHDVYDSRSLYACTEAYATTEMLQGGDPHAADDIYALSLIAYQLFTGVHPFRRHSAATAAGLGLTPAAPKGLRKHEWRTLEAGLSFDRRHRPADAAAFAARFFPSQRPRHVLVAGMLLLAATVGYLAYRNYEASGPALAFEQLALPVQEDFRKAMEDGDRLWQFYDDDGNLLALQEATEQYARAYALHPGNRQAVSALERVADTALRRAETQQRAEVARALAARSDYLARYPPVMSADR